MPARTGNTTYIPGRGATTVKPSGKKTFVGKGPAPAGATKLPEPSASEVPTVTVSSSGAKATGFKSPQAARQALRAQRARTKAVLQTTRQKPSVKPQLPKRPIQKVIAEDRQTFAREQGPKAPPIKMVAVKAHLRQQPKAVKVVKEKLAKAKQRAPHVTGPLVPEQKRFVNRVAKATHLSPRAVGAQALAEQSGSAAKSYEEQGQHNYLNIGPGQFYPTLKQGVHETAHLINTSSNYAGIRAERGKGAAAQVAAIGASPWGTNASTMAATLQEVGQKGKPIPARLLKRAKALGINPKASNVGKPSRQTIQKFKAAVKTMGAINSKNFPYVWGGGHGSFSGPYDCSGAISAMIHSVAPNRIKAPLVSGSMGQVLKPGPGAITVFYNGVHTFAYIPSLHKYWGTSESNAGGGAGFFPKSVGDSEVASGNSAGAYNVGHVPGLGKKEAFQLGATDLGSAQSFPGMSLSPSGTSATIEPGAGTTQSKPGFSNSPIRLTRGQRVAKINNKLKALGVGGEETSSAPATSISELERKYGQRVV